jgi:hypothetical protein
MSMTIMLRRRGTDILYPYHEEMAKNPNMESVLVGDGGVPVAPPSEAEIVAAAVPPSKAEIVAAVAPPSEAEIVAVPEKPKRTRKPKAEGSEESVPTLEQPTLPLEPALPQVDFGDLGDAGGVGSPVLTGNPDLDAELTKAMNA